MGMRWRLCSDLQAQEATGMTVILELPPDVGAQVATEAAQKGMPLPDYLVAVITPLGLKTRSFLGLFHPRIVIPMRL